MISAYRMLEPAESAERVLPVGIANQGRATNGHQRHLLTQILDGGVIVDGPGSDPIHSWKEASTYGLLAIALTLLTCGVALGAAGYYFYRRHREMIIYADTDAFYQACAGALGEQVGTTRDSCFRNHSWTDRLELSSTRLIYQLHVRSLSLLQPFPLRISFLHAF